MHRSRHLLALLALLFAASALAFVGPGPVFGPRTYERTTGQTNTYQDTFSAPQAGNYHLLVLNGDDEGSQVSSAEITLNGQVVVSPSELNQNVERIDKPVDLLANNVLDVTIGGQPGSYLTLVIAGAKQGCHMTAGRIFLPWGQVSGGPGAGADLDLMLKNGSPWGERAVKIAYLNPNGSLHALSGPVVLPPRSSLRLDVEADANASGWLAGSIEIFYAGPKEGRVAGYAAVDAGAGCISQMAPLLPGGHHHHHPGR